MSSSSRRDTREVGVGLEEDSVKRMFPPALIKSSNSFGVRAGPRPVVHQYNTSV